MKSKRRQRRTRKSFLFITFAFIASLPQTGKPFSSAAFIECAFLVTDEQVDDALKSPIKITIYGGSETLCLHSNPGAFVECSAMCDDESSPEPCFMSISHNDEPIRADDRHTIDCWHWNITVPAMDSPDVLKFAGCKFGMYDVQLTDEGKYTCKLTRGSSVDRRSVPITVLSGNANL